MDRIAYQGEPGAFSEEAVRRYSPKATPVPCVSFEDLFRAIPHGHADAVMVPVHNTLAGPVHASLVLLARSVLFITAETKVQVRMQLAGLPGARINDLRVVRSHPVALKQCKEFFAQHPEIRAEETFDTAGSIRELMEAENPTQGAIGSARAIELYGAQLLERDIHDVPDNYTRFLLLAAQPRYSEAPDALAFLVPEHSVDELKDQARRSSLADFSVLPAGATCLMELHGGTDEVARAKARLSADFHLLGAYKRWHDATWT